MTSSVRKMYTSVVILFALYPDERFVNTKHIELKEQKFSA